MRFLLSTLVIGLFAVTQNAAAQQATHGLAMHGELALAADFTHYQHADLRALKGGTLRQAQLGSFDSLNPFSIRGNAARNIRERVFESLLDRNYDEAFSLYGLLAESVSTAEDRSSVTFRLRPQARFSDGVPVTAADVAFTLELLKTQGRPNHRYYYGKVESFEITDDRTITLNFDANNPDRELPLILGLMPILPRHIYESRDIQAASLQLPIGSGPYVIEEITPGAQVRFQKQADYWADDLPLMVGRHNFQLIVEDYFRDENTAFEAFKAGDVDIWFERKPQRWLSGYQFPAAKDGRVRKQAIPLATPSGLRAFVLNTRRNRLQSPELRQALDLLFDFQWVNKVLYGGVYQRTDSYFGNTPLSAQGQPASDEEMALLQDSPIDKPSWRKAIWRHKATVPVVTGNYAAKRWTYCKPPAMSYKEPNYMPLTAKPCVWKSLCNAARMSAWRWRGGVCWRKLALIYRCGCSTPANISAASRPLTLILWCISTSPLYRRAMNRRIIGAPRRPVRKVAAIMPA